MSVEAMAAVLHHSRAKGTAKLVLLGIANHAGDGGAWPSKATLATYANCKPATIKNHLRTLRGLGEVKVYVNGGGLADDLDYLRPNRYEVLVSCPPWCDRSLNHKDTRKRSRQGRIPVDKPGGESDPGSDLIPGPGNGDAPLTGTTNRDTTGPALPTGHASPDAGPACFTCALPRVRCQSRQAKWIPADRHEFTPRERPTS